MRDVITSSSVIIGLLLAAGTASAADWQLELDARLSIPEGRRSFYDGGLGALRFGGNEAEVQTGRARFALSLPVGEVFAARLDASTWGTDDKNPVDLTEAYVEYRPYPRNGYRTRVKLGAFYAPISLENYAAGWQSPYTTSSSALNTWIAEELRTIGLEARLDWLGTRMGHDLDVGAVAAVFAWNDPAGGVLASHGFALHDRQTTLFGRVGPKGVPPLKGRELFHEIDRRPGYYVGVEARYLDRITLNALHYDNRGDPAAYDPELDDFAWETRFDGIGLHADGASGWTVIAQWLDGDTYIAPPGMRLEWPFRARFVLLSKRLGRHRLSARYDDFEVASNLRSGAGRQDGRAWTAAYTYELDTRWRLSVEWLRVNSHLQNRAIYLGEPPFARESKLELGIRWIIGSEAP